MTLTFEDVRRADLINAVINYAETRPDFARVKYMTRTEVTKVIEGATNEMGAKRKMSAWLKTGFLDVNTPLPPKSDKPQIFLSFVSPEGDDDRWQLRIAGTKPISFMEDPGFVGWFKSKEGDSVEFWTGFNNDHPNVPAKETYPTRAMMFAAITLIINANTPADYAWHVLDGLASALSPENLCCDGELRGAKLQAKHKKLLKQWAEQEAIIGRKVSIDEVHALWAKKAGF